MKTNDIVQKVLKECSTKVYVPPSLRGFYNTIQTPYGTRLDKNKI